MPVFDFKDIPDSKAPAVCTYTVFQSSENEATPEKPIMVLDNSSNAFAHHTLGMFINPIKRTSFEFKSNSEKISADILKIDSRFTSLYKWLGENHIKIKLSGKVTAEGYAVYKIREQSHGDGNKVSGENGFLQYMISRLLASDPPAEDTKDDDEREVQGDAMKLTSIQSITDFLACAGKTLPENIQIWARRNLAVAKSNEVSPEERRHAHSCVRSATKYHCKRVRILAERFFIRHNFL